MSDSIATASVCVLALGALVFEINSYRSRVRFSLERVAFLISICAVALVVGSTGLGALLGQPLFPIAQLFLFGAAFGLSVALVAVWLASESSRTKLGQIASQALTRKHTPSTAPTKRL